VRARHLRFEDTDRLSRAVKAFREGRGDLSDYLIREHARKAGCDRIATFDKVLLREDGFFPP
jgi:predicted nucleic-acid-binding protein